MWLKAGIQCTIQEIEQSELIQNALTGKFQATAWQQFNSPDPDGNYVWWSTKSVQPIGGLSLNMARNSDPLIQQALETGRESTDPHDEGARLPGGGTPVRGRPALPVGEPRRMDGGRPQLRPELRGADLPRRVEEARDDRGHHQGGGDLALQLT